MRETPVGDVGAAGDPPEIQQRGPKVRGFDQGLAAGRRPQTIGKPPRAAARGPIRRAGPRRTVPTGSARPWENLAAAAPARVSCGRPDARRAPPGTRPGRYPTVRSARRRPACRPAARPGRSPLAACGRARRPWPARADRFRPNSARGIPAARPTSFPGCPGDTKGRTAAWPFAPNR